MTEEILDLMEERRIQKGKKPEYLRLQNMIRRKIREAKEMIAKCEEIEYYQSKYDDFIVHKKVRELTGNFRKKSCRALVSEEGNLILGLDEKKTNGRNIWKDCSTTPGQKIHQRKTEKVDHTSWKKR